MAIEPALAESSNRGTNLWFECFRFTHIVITVAAHVIQAETLSLHGPSFTLAGDGRIHRHAPQTLCRVDMVSVAQ